MKNRLFALLLASSTLISMVVAPAYAEGAEAQNITDATALCGCGCGQKLEDITWKPWAAKPGSGHYYLTSDYVMDEFIVISGESNVLDLRGHTITSKSYSRLLLVYGQMYVLDERFRNNIDKHGDGTAAFASKAIEIYCK